MPPLINNAYGGVSTDRIVGGPGWMDTLPFTIDAKAEEGSMPKRSQLNETTLLEHRFKLKYQDLSVFLPRQHPGRGELL